MNRFAIVIVGLLVSAGSSLAHPHPHPPRLGVEMQLIVNGRVIGGTSGTSTVFVPVRELGCEYVVRIRNHLSTPIEAVVSVDGLSVINGRRASESIRGYLVEPHATVDIPGWRRGSRKVAAFTFSHEEESYAYRTGRRDGIGVIRLTAFEQSRPKIATREFRVDERSSTGLRNRGAQPIGSEKAGGLHRKVADVERIGTGYGRELDHHVSRVPFQRSHRVHRLTIHYGSRARYVPLDEDFTPAPPSR